MTRVSLAASAAVLALAIPAAAQDAPGPDVHFKGPRGRIERGVRCATPGLSAAQRAEVDRAVAQARDMGATEVAQAAAAAGGITVPVVFHVIHDGTEGNVPDSMVTAQLQVLNDAFGARGFSFSLQAINRVNDRRAFTGCYSNQKFKKSLAVDPANTLNFYTCKPKGNILGYAYLPWSFAETDYRHGVVVLYSSLPGGSAEPYNEGDTGTHEVGHYLGLYHTFERGCQAPGDQVADTAYEASAAYGCPTGRDSCPDVEPDPITNFMDYTDDFCMDNFSPDQGARMQEIVATYKPGLLN